MRRQGWFATVLTGCLATLTASVAGAQVAPSQIVAGAAAAVPSTGRPPLLAPIALGGAIERTTRLTSKLRLRIATSSASAGPNERVHPRLASSMVDIYPLSGSGFHLSAGSRLYDARAGEQATSRGLMVSQRILPGAGGGRVGLRRTPALTVGYSGTVAEATSVGVEVGAMKGRAYDAGGRLARPTRGEREGLGNGPINPVVNLVVGRRF